MGFLCLLKNGNTLVNLYVPVQTLNMTSMRSVKQFCAARPGAVCENLESKDTCYDLVRVTVRHGRPCTSLAATFIITMQSEPTRGVECLARVMAVGPSRDYVVVHNKGHRACSKSDANDTASDLHHCNRFILSYARTHLNGGRILILEDDCAWQPRARAALRDIDAWLNSRDDVDHYFLGCMVAPFRVFPVSMRHWRTFGMGFGAGGGSHAVIHTPRGYHGTHVTAERERHVDFQFVMHGRAFMYWRPVATQTWPVTANSSTWDGPVVRSHHRMLGLEWRAQPGFTIVYGLAMALPVLVAAVLFTVVIRAVRAVGAVRAVRAVPPA